MSRKCRSHKGFSQDVCNIVPCWDPAWFEGTHSNVFADEVIVHIDVLGTRVIIGYS